MHKAISEFEAGIRAAAISCLASAPKGLSMARAVFTVNALIVLVWPLALCSWFTHAAIT
jgi:hypothetical protein